MRLIFTATGGAVAGLYIATDRPVIVGKCLDFVAGVAAGPVGLVVLVGIGLFALIDRIEL